jgi:hypothetical protein
MKAAHGKEGDDLIEHAWQAKWPIKMTAVFLIWPDDPQEIVTSNAYELTYSRTKPNIEFMWYQLAQRAERDRIRVPTATLRT